MVYLVDNESSTAYLRYRLDRVFRSVTNVPGASILRVYFLSTEHSVEMYNVFTHVYSLLGSPFPARKSRNKSYITYNTHYQPLSSLIGQR